jgi:hypothetical protein
VQLAPGIPCALCFMGNGSCKTSGDQRRGIAELYLFSRQNWLFENRIHLVVPDKRANGSRERAPDDRLRERDPGPITTNVQC